MTLRSKIARGLKWQAINIAGRQILSFAVFTIMARLLDPPAFGMFGLVTVYAGFVAMIADQGIGTALVQRLNLNSEHLDAAFWFNLFFASVLAFSTLAFAHPVAMSFGNSGIAPLLRWSSLALLFSALSSIQTALFVKALDFRRPAIRTLLANSVGGAVGITAAFAGFGVWSLVIQQLTAGLVGTIFLWTVSPYRPSLRFSLKHLRELWGAGFWVFAAGLMWYVTSNADRFFIGRIAGLHVLGLYIISNKLPEMAKTMIREPTAGISVPVLSRLQEVKEQFCQAVYQGMEFNATLSFAIFVGCAATAPEIIPLVFGGKWAAAAGVSSLLSLAALVSALKVFIHPSLIASGGFRQYAFFNGCQTAGCLVACLVGIRFSVSYLVVGMIANNLLVTIPVLLFLRKAIGLSPLKYCQTCAIPLSAALIMVGAIFISAAMLPDNAPLAIVLACKVLVGAGTYLGVIFIANRKVLKDIGDILRHSVHPSAGTEITSL